MLQAPMSGYAGVVLIVYGLLSAVAVVAIDLRVVLIPTACVVLGLIAAGFVVFRPIRGAVAIPWPAHTSPEGEPTIMINGQPCPFRGYEQELLVEVRPRRLTELAACGALASAVLYVVLSGLAANTSQIGLYEAEAICIGGSWVLLTSLRWFAERRFLAFSRIQIGTILAVDPGFFRRGVTYQFFDQQGERRGGKGPVSNDNADNVVVVLYRPSDPDTNAIHGAFSFHQFRIGLLPGRRKARTEAGVQT